MYAHTHIYIHIHIHIHQYIYIYIYCVTKQVFTTYYGRSLISMEYCMQVKDCIIFFYYTTINGFTFSLEFQLN